MDADGETKGRGQSAQLEVARRSNKTFSMHIVLDGKCPYHGVHDQATTSTTIAVALRFGGGYRGFVGAVDAAGGPSAGR